MIKGKCGVDFEFQVSVLGKVGPSDEIRNSRLGSRLERFMKKVVLTCWV